MGECNLIEFSERRKKKIILMSIGISIIAFIVVWTVLFISKNQVIWDLETSNIKDMWSLKKWVQFDIFSHSFR